jgi:hypothetical protein
MKTLLEANKVGLSIQCSVTISYSNRPGNRHCPEVPVESFRDGNTTLWLCARCRTNVLAGAYGERLSNLVLSNNQTINKMSSTIQDKSKLKIKRKYRLLQANEVLPAGTEVHFNAKCNKCRLQTEMDVSRWLLASPYHVANRLHDAFWYRTLTIQAKATNQ